MANNSRNEEGYDPTSQMPPSESWLFAQAILGKPIPEIVDPRLAEAAERAELKRLAQFSTRHADELRRREAADAAARRDREILEWSAGISTRAEEQLRALELKEAKQREAWERAAQYAHQLREDRRRDLDARRPRSHPSHAHSNEIAEWNADQPRVPAGSPQGGQWAGGLLGGIIRRNQMVSDLTGGGTPELMRSSRLAAQLQSAASLPAELRAAVAAGLRTGGKAVVNGTATAIKNVATLGLSSSQLELIGVTKEDRDQGYDTAVTIATASGQTLVAVGTAGLATALGAGGTVARTASGALTVFDAAGNAVGTVQGAYDASQNGLNLENGLQIAGGALGLAANAKGAGKLTQAASAAEVKKVDEYIAKCPKQATPTGSRADQYEIAHTGPHNYTVSGGGATFNIDGYRGTTILEAKHVGDVESSPYVPGSSCPDHVRKIVLDGAREELKKMQTIIRSGKTPLTPPCAALEPLRSIS